MTGLRLWSVVSSSSDSVSNQVKGALFLVSCPRSVTLPHFSERCHAKGRPFLIAQKINSVPIRELSHV